MAKKSSSSKRSLSPLSLPRHSPSSSRPSSPLLSPNKIISSPISIYVKTTLYPWVRLWLYETIKNPSTRKIFLFLLLNLSFTFVEAIYGVLTNSLGLTSDAIHMLFDSSVILLGLIASLICRWDANDRYSYGYGRVETLAGFVSGLLLLLASISIIWEAVERLVDPKNIEHEDSLFVVSVLGLLVNLVGIFAFDHGHAHDHSHTHGHDQHDHHCHSHHHNHNNHNHHGHHHHSPLMQGMFLHVLSDTLGSVGVIASSLLIRWYGWTWSDPLCSVFIAVLTIFASWPLVKSTAKVLLQRIPDGLERKTPSFYQEVISIQGVSSATKPHIWELSPGHYVGSMKISLNTTYLLLDSSHHQHQSNHESSDSPSFSKLLSTRYNKIKQEILDLAHSKLGMDQFTLDIELSEQ